MENRGQYQKNPPLNIEQLERLVVELKGWGVNDDEKKGILNDIVRMCSKEIYRLTGVAIRKARGEDNGDRNDCKDRTSQRFRYAELCLQEDPEIVNNNGLR
jgi:hypothetical protein